MPSDLGTKPGGQAVRPVPGDDTATSDPGKQNRVAAGIPVVAAFDGYRAYGILGIVLLHLLGYSGVLGTASDSWFNQLVFGTLGQFVDILFIISGFVVFLPTVARGGDFGSVGAYAIRRGARLMPAYWLTIAIILILLATVPLEPPISFPSLASIGAHAGALQTPVGLFRNNFAIGFGVDGPLWTLSLEVAFYLILPLIATRYFRRPLLGLALAALVTVIWHEAFNHWAAVTRVLGLHPSGATSLRIIVASFTQFPFFAFSFGAGMTGAWAYVRLRERYGPELLARRAAPVQLASLAVLAVFVYVTGHSEIHGPPSIGDQVARRDSVVALGYTGALATLMIATALGAERWQRPFARPFARWLGDISYGIYLVHLVIMTFALHWMGLPDDGSAGAFFALTALVMPVSILYGYLSARYLEQPIRRWAQRYGRRLQKAQAAARAPAGG